MKIILTVMLVISCLCSTAQNTTTRINELEKWRTQAKAQLNRDSISIVALRIEKSKDSLRISLLDKNQREIMDTLKALNNARTLYIRKQNIFNDTLQFPIIK